MSSLPISTNDLKTDVSLSEKEISIIENAKENIHNSFNQAQVRFTKTELENSILNDVAHPTIDSKYWQCKLELKTHSGYLVQDDFEVRLKAVDVEELEEKILTEENEIQKKRLRIQLERESYTLHVLRSEVKNRTRQIKFLDDKIRELESECQFSITNIEEHQVFSYLYKYAREYKIARMSNGTTGGELRNMMGHLMTTFQSVFNDEEKRKIFSETVPHDVLGILREEKLLINKEAS